MKQRKLVKGNTRYSFDKYIYNVLLIALLTIPLVMRTMLTEVYSPLILNNYVRSIYQIEFFNYPRFILLIVFTIVLVCLFLIKIVATKEKLVPDRLIIIWSLLYFTVLLSVILAEYKTLTIIGQFGLYEGALSFICYLLIFFICVHIKYEFSKLRYILNVLSFIVIINAIMGLLAFAGIDVFKYSIVKWLFTSNNVAINEGSYITSTFNNPNYASGIAAVFFMIFFVMSLLEEAKERWFYLGITCLSFAFLLSALSTSGFLTIVVLIPVALFLTLRRVSLKKIAVPVVLLFAICVGIYYPMAAHNPRVYQETFGFIYKSIDSVTMSSRIAYAAEGDSIGYMKIKSTSSDDAYQEVFGLPKPGQGAGSGRVYIWSKTLELIKKKPLIGYGLGTLGLYFDNNDPNKIANMWYEKTIVTKPHNYYLGLAFGIGIVGLILFILLVFSFLIAFIKAYLHVKQITPIHTSLFMGICAYLIQGLINDSIIGMSVVFWIIFGISTGLLRQIVKG